MGSLRDPSHRSVVLEKVVGMALSGAVLAGSEPAAGGLPLVVCSVVSSPQCSVSALCDRVSSEPQLRFPCRRQWSGAGALPQQQEGAHADHPH